MNWFKKISDWLLPCYCALCHNPTTNTALCTPCTGELPWLKNPCVCCAKPLISETIIHPAVCGDCLTNPPSYQALIAPFQYKYPIDYLILNLKFGNKFIYARILGELMAETIARHYQPINYPQLIIPVPLHPRRLRERGYNQAVEIARPIQKKFRLPLSVHQCGRIIDTQPQAAIAASGRSRNVKSAFSAALSIKATHVAIIDDVVTTGSTVSELTQALRKVGVKKIDIWCCSRTHLNGPGVY